MLQFLLFLFLGLSLSSLHSTVPSARPFVHSFIHFVISKSRKTPGEKKVKLRWEEEMNPKDGNGGASEME